ncbi:MAG: type VI secretion system tip protein TssI/VgrG [Desulfatitalea sp.]
MATFSQANAPRFTFAVEGNEWLVVEFTVRESISTPFEIEVTLAVEEEIKLADAVGKVALLTIESADNDRLMHGMVNRFVQTGVNGRFFLYQARVVPQLWLLSLARDCRIFQNKSVPDIVRQTLEDSGMTSDLFDFRLQGSYAPREYCVQYRESDLDYISRLLEEEGIFYFFEHSKEKHLLVFGDGAVNYQPIAGEAQVVFNAGSAMVAEEEAVVTFQLARQIRTGKYTLRDFNFEKPSLDLTADHSDKENKRLEVYDFPGEYATTEEGRRLVQVRLQEAVLFKERAEGKSVVPRLVPGFTFTLNSHVMDSFNQEYLLTSVVHSGAQPQVLAEKASSAEGTRYENLFEAIPSAVTFRPERQTAKPVVEGVQTAIVTGPSGEEIYPDKHGRVKVQFHWDRLGKKDENSSCWIRVSQAWAGAGWGAMFIPRIGQEVIVDFIEGDPDRPIITGRVYHGSNTPPYGLPAQKTKSTIKSDSTTGGGGSNEIRFEDKKGSEEIYLHGQKDWTIAIENNKNQTVGNNETLSVGSNRTKRVGNDQSETIGVNKTIDVGANHTETIGVNKTESIGVNKTETIGANASLTVGANQTEDVAIVKAVTVGAAYQITVGAAMNETVGAVKAEEIGAAKTVVVGADSSETVGNDKSVSAGKNISMQSGKKMTLAASDDFAIAGSKKGVIEIKEELTIKVGQASITLKKNGDILIKGKKIDLKGSGNITIKGQKVLEN